MINKYKNVKKGEENVVKIKIAVNKILKVVNK